MSPDTRVDTITDEFRQRINGGEFGTAGRLPSLRLLANQFDTTHETMNKVVQRLQAEGLLLSLGRAGIFVNTKRKRIPGLTPRFDEVLRQQGMKPIEIDIETPAIVSAPPVVAQAFQIPEGTNVVRRYRSQGEDKGITEVFYRLAENFYPLEFVSGEILQQMQQDVHFDVLAAIRKIHSKEIKQVHDDVIVRFPDAREQELLNIVRNTPVIDVRRTNYAEEDDGEVIMFNHIVFVASYFVLSYDYTPYWLK